MSKGSILIQARRYYRSSGAEEPNILGYYELRPLRQSRPALGKAGPEETEKIDFFLRLIYHECPDSTLQRCGQKAVASKLGTNAVLPASRPRFMTGAFFFDGLKASLCELVVLLEQERHALSVVRKLATVGLFYSCIQLSVSRL